MADNTEIGTVRQVQTGDGLYDIEAPKLVAENSYEVNKINVKPTSGSAIVGLNLDEENATGGVIELNNKGNLSIESLSKHVNIEAKNSIQMKPTKKIIIDTGRREDDSGENEAIIEVNNDDTKEWGELKIKSRNLDLRCHDHGGIALQPCGADDNDFENKIKFESSRTSSLSTQNPTYATEGGKGLEFGTFNNEHTSLFTKDYRFNKDGVVYAVTRGTPSTIDGKFDYPTQEDDFKDVIASNTRSCAWEYIVMAGNIIEYLSSHYGLPPYTAENLLTAFNAVCTPLPVIYNQGEDYNDPQ